jgi:flagellar FliL protein
MAGLIFLGGSVAAVLKLGWMSNPELSKGKKIESTGIDEREIGPIVKLAPLVINLKEDSGRHYLKTTVILELGGKDKVEDIQAKMSSLMDIAILTLSEKRLEELRDLGMKERLKQELLEKMNQPLDSKRIKRIYFDEFLYQ